MTQKPRSSKISEFPSGTAAIARAKRGHTRKSGLIGRHREARNDAKAIPFPGPDGRRAWDIDRLVILTKDFPAIQVPLGAIGELDEPYWYDHGYVPTCRNIAEHARLINEADLAFPIILSSDGRVMDGMHRAAKAFMEGRNSISARQFIQDPEPDYIGVDPDKLPY